MLDDSNNVERSYDDYPNVKGQFVRGIQREFKKTFPSQLSTLISTILVEEELTASFLSLLLRSMAQGRRALALKSIFEHVNSEFDVIRLDGAEIEEWETGGCDLVYRIPKSLKDQAEPLKNKDDDLREAWNECFRVHPKPNYDSVVSNSIDFFEGYLRDRYYLGTDR
ncbi:MAG TPA: hypothetical protein PLV25_04060, partial [Opitutales bacterium]|nr:hypothetical protein [Opitutales bacterium]